MNVFFEEEGSFKVASVMTENPSSLQVEAISGKRSKIKSANVLMRFEGALSGFMESASAEAEGLDVPFLWECCGEPEFGFEELAEEYYGGKPTSIQAAAIAIRLHSAPMYFYRKGKGRYKAAPEETLQAALAGLEKKRQQAEKVAQYVEQLKAGQLPAEFDGKVIDALLYQPDKNSLEWKALEQAASETNQHVVRVLASCGAIASVHDYHLGAFLREYFAEGQGFPDMEPPIVPSDLPRAEAEAFSIDDSTTTEIDDAFTIVPLADGVVRVGIHIAAPALGILPGSQLDQVVMQRLSTVYMPGHKITMLPDEVVAPFSLNQGEWRSALSLYLDVAPDLSIVKRESRVEQVKVAENLRHDTLEPFFNENTLDQDTGHPYWQRLLFLFRLAESLEKARGKYDPTRPVQLDYSFYVNDGRVRILARRRGAPIDKLVAELMIEANSHWGGLLAEHHVPGIYRAQNGGKVYMTVKAEPHQGLGVSQYSWSTSPLRRAVDLVNQRQIISVVQGDEPVYPPGSDDLAVVMRNFDLTYNAYNEFQTRMERYWCLQYLLQEDIHEIGATVWRESLVRLDGMPLIAKVHGMPELAPGSRVRIEIQKVDTLLIELESRFKSMEHAEAAAESEAA
ncbi:ribonuclease catalytic domain-containing protein [Methylobacillus flagellatus]|uniref:Ribonuclease II n=1 Tax=Methylobacillus flagellatus (strain ATCC 51484 / DSM 6875 / VKM B-1610 / KT) TaxID=265072 RepID=Q1H1Y5_METFK|nr:RNB domain-containing ribonuclease [Methylobacillus flagellatus]ABE49502.1 ribonuclease II [Methylobacillus flagellatus KT]